MNRRIIERSIRHHTNRERKKRGLRPLKPERSLIDSGRKHAKWLAQRDKGLTHIGASGSTPTDRARYAGYGGYWAGDLLWQSPRGSRYAWKSKFRWSNDWQMGKAAVISWLNSPRHRSHLLAPGYHHIGCAVARSSKGTLFFVNNLGDWGGPLPHEARKSKVSRRRMSNKQHPNILVRLWRSLTL